MTPESLVEVGPTKPNPPINHGGARFYKCDLQMQTPEDSGHWEDPTTKLGDPRDPARTREIARTYLRRCHEVGLEVIAITDHNLARKEDTSEWFLTALIEENASVAASVGRDPLTIFPGFELDIGYHVLCLFEPGTKLDKLNHCLSSLGLTPASRFDGKSTRPCKESLKRVLAVVQDEHAGIVIAAHGDRDNGIFRDAKHRDDFKEPGLLAVEVTKMPLQGREEAFVRNRDVNWQRSRPAAYIMSSDAKALTEHAGNQASYIGGRHTWIKMDRPSIGSLKQAFLDQAHQIVRKEEAYSRIRFGPTRPEAGHAAITRIKVANAMFLGDLEVRLSPHLNALVGGRGTGKSTLIEYLRFALAQTPEDAEKSVTDTITELRGAIQPDTIIELDILRDGVSWTVRSVGGAPATVVVGEPVPNLRALFPIRVFSQRQIFGASRSRQARLRILDNVAGAALAEILRSAQDARRDLTELNNRIAAIPDLAAQLAAAESERIAVQNKLALLAPHLKGLSEWHDTESQRRFLEDVKAKAETRIKSSISSGLPATPLPPPPPSAPNALAEYRTAVEAVLHNHATSLASAVETALLELETLGVTDGLKKWREVHDAQKAQAHATIEQLEKEGLNATEHENLADALARKTAEIERLKEEVAARKAAVAQRNDLARRLAGLVKEEQKVRAVAAERLNAAMPSTSAGTPLVRVDLVAFGDQEAFKAALMEILGTSQRFKTPDLEALADWVITSTPPGESPANLLASWAEALGKGETPSGCPFHSRPIKMQELTRLLVAHFAAIQALRVPDLAKVTLSRDDGSLAGDIEGGLSVGQRCTAILALLLAADPAPLIVDQPEDDLDNSFVFTHLVPLMRRVKHERQLVVATHNANIPVNADAELVIALEVRGGRGVVRKSGGSHAVGALDRPVVKDAVGEIMEGSAEAFTRRRERYGY